MYFADEKKCGGGLAAQMESGDRKDLSGGASFWLMVVIFRFKL